MNDYIVHFFMAILEFLYLVHKRLNDLPVVNVDLPSLIYFIEQLLILSKKSLLILRKLRLTSFSATKSSAYSIISLISALFLMYSCVSKLRALYSSGSRDLPLAIPLIKAKYLCSCSPNY